MKQLIACALLLSVMEFTDASEILADKIRCLLSSGRESLHIVTLTRRQEGKSGGNTMRNTYSPITASEACTVFAIANLFLGRENDEHFHCILARAGAFDEAQFARVDDFNKNIIQKKEEKIQAISEKVEDLSLQETKNILLYAAKHEGMNIKPARAKIRVKGEEKEEELNLKGGFLNSPE